MPADVILLRTTEKAGSCFIRTDQLDGETDWKLRLAVGTTQKLTVSTDRRGLENEVVSFKSCAAFSAVLCFRIYISYLLQVVIDVKEDRFSLSLLMLQFSADEMTNYTYM